MSWWPGWWQERDGPWITVTHSLLNVSFLKYAFFPIFKMNPLCEGKIDGHSNFIVPCNSNKVKYQS